MTTSIELGQPLFARAEDAVTFALHYAHDQSPTTPMSRILKRSQQLGNGKGLIGIDGAHQAGSIKRLLEDELSPMALDVLYIRFGDVRQVCPCCGNADAPTRTWREAVDRVSFIEPIKDLHPKLRHAIVEKVVCNRRLMMVTQMASKYDVSRQTIHGRLRRAKEVLGPIETTAINLIHGLLQDRGVVVKEE